jgi:GTP-binding protein
MTTTPPTADNANRLFAGDCDFILAASDIVHFPPTKLPEIAFWGRSNVGKSSLINALTGRNHLARSSKTPGRTQEIIFFNLGDKIMLADLPGYGHAEAPRSERERWNDLIRHYVQARPPLRLICLLIDGRHGLLAKDLETLRILDRGGVSYQVILTKIDQVHALERDKKRAQVAAALAKHPAAREDVMAVSAEKRIGLEEIRVLLTDLADKPKPTIRKPKTLQ